MEWVGSRGLVPALQGPVVDFRSFFSRRGIVLNYDLPGQPAGANAFGVDYQRVDLDDGGRLDQRSGFVQPGEAGAVHADDDSAFPAANPTRVFDLYIFDSTNDGTTNYDRVLVVRRNGRRRTAAAAVADLGRGRLGGRQGHARPGRAPARRPASTSRRSTSRRTSPSSALYFTSVGRVNATYNALGPAGSAAFEETLARDFPTSTAADFAPLEAGIVDEDTYVEQGLMWKDAHWAYLHYIFEDPRRGRRTCSSSAPRSRTSSATSSWA